MAAPWADFIDLQALGDASLAEAIFDEVLLRNSEHDDDASAVDSLSKGPLSKEEGEQRLVDSDDDGGTMETTVVLAEALSSRRRASPSQEMSAAMMTCVDKTE